MLMYSIINALIKYWTPGISKSSVNMQNLLIYLESISINYPISPAANLQLSHGHCQISARLR